VQGRFHALAGDLSRLDDLGPDEDDGTEDGHECGGEPHP
jgi:hypothetical protein